MSIRKLRARADELSRGALLERRRCKESLTSALAIIRRRVGSPAGLAISFSLGFIAGTPRSRKSGRRGPRGSAREQLTGTVIGSAARLLVPMLTNALVLASQDTAGAAAGHGHQPSRSARPASADATADAA